MNKLLLNNYLQLMKFFIGVLYCWILLQRVGKPIRLPHDIHTLYRNLTHSTV